MNFEISKDTIQDLVAMYGAELAIQQIQEAFMAALETAISEIYVAGE